MMCIRHRAPGHACGVIVLAEGPLVPSINDQRCLRWLFIYLIKGRQTHLPSPLRDTQTTFSASNFDVKIGLLFKALKSNQNHPKISENRPQDPPKTPLK